MRRYKKPVLLPLILFLYTTVMAVYFLPRNSEISSTEKWLTVAGSYVIIALLWFVLRKKEQLAERRDNELKRLEKEKLEKEK